MPPKASTSTANAAPAKKAAGAGVKKTADGAAASKGTKLSAKEKQLYDFAMKCENHIITQDMVAAEFDWKAQDFVGDLNTLAKKRLLTLSSSNSGEVFWTGVSISSAQQAANNSDEGNLLLDLIRQAGNMGIWSRTLKTKSGLHQTVIDKCLKALEGQRAIKAVKSIKHPTRKMYLLYNTTPSTELTGGPWYSGSDLDVDFVTSLQKLCKKLIDQASSSSGGSDQLFPVGHTPYLPTSHDILRGIKEIGATSVPLSEEHVESLLEVLRMDGDIERIQVMREPGDYDSEAEEADEGHTSKGKKRKADDGGGRNKKRVKMENGEDNQEEGDNSDDIDGFIVPDDEQEGDDLPPPIEIHGNGQTSARRKRPGPPGRSKFYYVYRSMPLASNNLNLYIGLIDAPCGVCPVAASCDNRGRPSMDDEPLSQVGVVNVVAGSASKLSKAQKEKQLVAFKPPGSMGAVDMAGPWTGGASRGVQRPGAINPSTCRYFREWLEG